MGWPYHFATLTSEQKHERRQLLDYYASIAQLSVLAPLLILQMFYWGTYLSSKITSSARQNSPSSPALKEKRLRRSQAARGFLTSWRRFQWWCASPLQVGRYELGSNGEIAVSLFWLGWLLSLCVLQTRQDYLHLTKRFAIVGASQLPFHYLLAVKSPYSPLILLTRRSHESLNRLHQLLGRIIIVLLFLHAAFYLNFYVLSGLLAEKLQQAYVLCGIAAITGFATIGTSALAPLRRRYYKLFYIIHIALATTLPLVLFFHVTYIRIYLYETAAVFFAGAVLRMYRSKRVPARIRAIPDSNLVEVLVRVPREELNRWHVGQHAYLSTAPSYRCIANSNPFTLASVPAVDGVLRFVARVLKGNTRKLALVHGQDSVDSDHPNITIDGPYGVNTHPDRLLAFDRVLFVAGGVGATFIVPLFRQLLADLSPSKGSRRRQRVSFLWIAKTLPDVVWALPQDQKEREGFLERLRVCLTQSEGIEQQPSLNSGDGEADDFSPDLTNGQSLEAIELEERTILLQDSDSKEDSENLQQIIRPYAGRPDLARIVDQVFVPNTDEQVAIVVCGPSQLAVDLRREITRFVDAGRSVWFWEEQFAF